MLRDIPNITDKQQLQNLLQHIKQESAGKCKPLENWLKHKERNPWVLQYLNPSTSEMNRSDWYTTSSNTNIAESAHAMSQRDGIKLSLVTAIQKGKELDSRFLRVESGAQLMGIQHGYGNISASGRVQRNMVKAKAAKK